MTLLLNLLGATNILQAHISVYLLFYVSSFLNFVVLELLENLKQQHSSRRNISPETSPRDSRETTSFKLKLAERDDLIKKLKAKNSSYKQKIEELREKEIELTKALSLTEVGITALDKQISHVLIETAKRAWIARSDRAIEITSHWTWNE